MILLLKITVLKESVSLQDLVEELKTICDAHKTTILCSDSGKCKGIHLNINGTT